MEGRLPRDPPACYPVVSNGWFGDVPDPDKWGWAYTASEYISCEGFSKAVGRSYYATGGGVKHDGKLGAKVRYPWNVLQSYPYVQHRTWDETQTWRCVIGFDTNETLGKQEIETVAKSLYCYANCCQIPIQATAAARARLVDMPLQFQRAGANIASDGGIINDSRMPEHYVASIWRAAQNACAALKLETGSDYEFRSLHSPVIGYFDLWKDPADPQAHHARVVDVSVPRGAADGQWWIGDAI